LVTDFPSDGLVVTFCAEAGDSLASVSPVGDISADLKDAAETSSSSAALVL
jgi:hypothetical protein